MLFKLIDGFLKVKKSRKKSPSFFFLRLEKCISPALSCYSPMLARRQMAACTSTPAYTSASELTTGKHRVCTLILRSPNKMEHAIKAP